MYLLGYMLLNRENLGYWYSYKIQIGYQNHKGGSWKGLAEYYNLVWSYKYIIVKIVGFRDCINIKKYYTPSSK
jgi:hypothetical protein